jgi:hypothetical protein
MVVGSNFLICSKLGYLSSIGGDLICYIEVILPILTLSLFDPIYCVLFNCLLVDYLSKDLELFFLITTSLDLKFAISWVLERIMLLPVIEARLLLC